MSLCDSYFKLMNKNKKLTLFLDLKTKLKMFTLKTKA